MSGGSAHRINVSFRRDANALLSVRSAPRAGTHNTSPRRLSIIWLHLDLYSLLFFLFAGFLPNKDKARREFKKRVEAQFKEVSKKFPPARGLRDVQTVRDLISKLERVRMAS